MDKMNKKSGNKQIFIITPDELAKLGILGKISSAGLSSKPTEDSTSSPSTSKSVDKIAENPDICNILRSALKKKLKPQTDKNATIHQTKKLSVKEKIGKKIKPEVLSGELETAKNATVRQTQELSVKKKVGKKIRTEVLSGELELSGQTQESHVTAPKTTIKSSKKTVSVISNTAVNLSKDTIHKIVDSVSSSNSGKNINSKLKLIPTKVGPQNFQSTINTDFKNAIQTDDIEKTHIQAAAGNSSKLNRIKNETGIAGHDDKSNKIVENKRRDIGELIQEDIDPNLHKQRQIQEVELHGEPETDISFVEHPCKKNKWKKSKSKLSTECESVISDSYIVEPVEQSPDSRNESNEQLFQRKIDRNQCDMLIKGSKRTRITDTDKKLIRNTVIGRSISRKPPKLFDKQLDSKQISPPPVNTLPGSNDNVAETGLHDTDFINTEGRVQKEELEKVLKTPVDTSVRVITKSVKADESYEKSAKKKRGRKSKIQVVPEVQKNLEDISEKKENELAPINAVNNVERMQNTGDIPITSIDNSVKVLNTREQVDESDEKPAKKKGSRKSKNLVVPPEKNLEDISEKKETELVPILDQSCEKPTKKKEGPKSKNLVVPEVELEKNLKDIIEKKETELVPITAVNAIKIVQKSGDTSTTYIDNAVKVLNTREQVDESDETPAKKKGGRKSKNPVVPEVEPEKKWEDISEKIETELVPIAAVNTIEIVQKSEDTPTTYIDNAVKVLNTREQVDESYETPTKKKEGRKSKNLVVPVVEPEKNLEDISEKKETELVPITAINSIDKIQKKGDIPTISIDNPVEVLSTRVQVDENCEKPKKKGGQKSKNLVVPVVEPEKNLEDISEKKETEIVPIAAVDAIEIVQKSEDTPTTYIDNAVKVLNTREQVDESYETPTKKKEGRKSKNPVVPEVEPEKNLEDISEKKETELVPITAINSIDRIQKKGDIPTISIDNPVEVLSTRVQVDENCEKPKKKGGQKSKNLVVPVVEPEKNLKDISEKKETEIVPIAAVDAIEIVQKSGDTSTTYIDNAVKVFNTCEQIDETYEKPVKRKGGRENLVVPEVEPEKNLEDISEKKETELVPIILINSVDRMQKIEDIPTISIDNPVEVLSTRVEVDESWEKPKKKGGRKSKNLVVPEVEHEKNFEGISEKKETELLPIAAVDAIEIVQKSGDTPTTYIDNEVKVLNKCDQIDESYEKPAMKKGGRKSKNLVVPEVDLEKNLGDISEKKDTELVPIPAVNTIEIVQKFEDIPTTSIDNSVKVCNTSINYESCEKSAKKKEGRKSKNLVVPTTGPSGNIDKDHVDIIADQLMEEKNVNFGGDKKEIKPVHTISASISLGAHKTEQISTTSIDNSATVLNSRIKVNSSCETSAKKKRGRTSQNIVVAEAGSGGNTDYNIVAEQPIEDILKNQDKKEETQSVTIQKTGDTEEEDIDRNCEESAMKKGDRIPNNLVVPDMINNTKYTDMSIEQTVEKLDQLHNETTQEIAPTNTSEQTENNDNSIEKSGKKKRGRRLKYVWLEGVTSALSKEEKSSLMKKSIEQLDEEQNDKTSSASSSDVSSVAIETPVKKKRGRKPKTVSLTQTQSLITGAADTGTFDIGTEQNDQNEEFPTDMSVGEPSIEQPSKKRRGRPRKSDTPARVTINPEPIVKYDLEESKRGRKRAKINYFEVEMSTREPTKVTRKREASETLEPKPTKKKRDNEPDTDRKIEDIDEVNDEVDDLNKPVKDKRKYVFNGNTVKMWSQMFSVLQDNPDGEKSAVSANRFRGRPRKDNDVNRSLVCDEQNQVTCVICRETVLYEDWSDHNIDRHYNLAWRVGEIQLFLDDYSVLRSKLQPFFANKKTLSCLKCSKVCTKLLEFVCHREECEGILAKGQVTCAICNKILERKSWMAHKLKHNNLAWRVGDYPLDLNSDVLVLKILNALYVAKKPLTCETCGTVKKSVVGFLSHRGVCGKNIEKVKVKCEVCGRKCLPSSILSHMKSVHDPNKKNNSDYFNIDITAPHGKRKAAKRALDKIDEFAKEEVEEYFKYYEKQLDFNENKNFKTYLNKELHNKKSLKCKIQNCQFESDNISTFLDHISSCPSKPAEYYTCKTCFYTQASQEDIIKHLRKAHSLKIREDDDYQKGFSDEDEEDGVVSEKSRKRRSIAFQEKKQQLIKLKNDTSYTARPLFVLATTRWPKDECQLFSHAFKFAMKFCETHYIDSHDLKNLICNKDAWGLLEEESIERYLPPSDLSCDVSVKTINGYENVYNCEYTFKNYELFEVQRETDTITIFCGGPVHSLAWLPTPHTGNNKPQILAVGTSRDFDAMYRVDEFCGERTIIQFWNFGILRNLQEFSEPTFEFGLAVDYGPIWHLEWCPSVCYNVEDFGECTRLGLLAVGGSTMAVNIYSIPSLEDKSGLFYKPRPILKLQLTENEAELKRMCFPTKISWSKMNGSCFIAVGYSDGTVAVYNLKTVSNKLGCQDKNSTEILLPSKVIKAHSHYVSALSWIPVGNDRFLYSGSFDKTVYVWDLYSEDKFSTKKSGIVTDGTWLTNWISHITTTEETSPRNCNVVSTLFAHRSFIEDTSNLNSSLVTVLSLSASDWLNGFVQANSVGEVVAFFPHQMMLTQDGLRKGSKYRFLIGYTRLIEKSKSVEERTASEKKKRDLLTPTPERSKTSKVMDVVDDKELYYEPLDYREAVEKYGVVFCDSKSDAPSLRKNNHENTDLSKPHLYPLQEVRKVSFNPNRQASLYFASGYQIGFVRISYLKFLEKDPQIISSEKWGEPVTYE
ncbi:uncharacterized protein [Diabrotica undecimpunctata]|uniref:uncharacterized protein n=1 Tax=Diabrotica undecimpunctata TaxID=50387 RepID=UPI003B6410DF